MEDKPPVETIALDLHRRRGRPSLVGDENFEDTWPLSTALWSQGCWRKGAWSMLFGRA